MSYVFRDDSRLTPWMRYQINRLSADMQRIFGVVVLVTSGIRTHEEQVAIFKLRYVTAGDVRGRRVYDRRWWNGQQWYRISSVGTVAQPGTSNHEIQGAQAAVDLRDSGNDAGIATMGSARSNWLRANAHHYDLIPSGFAFGEAWHYDIKNIFATPPNTGGNSANVTPVQREEEDDDMGYYFYDVTNPNRPYRWFSEGRGKSRALTTAEWEARKAIASTGNGVPYQLVRVSANWYDKIVALGEY